MKTIILINGPKRGGKDYSATLLTEILKERINVRTLSFAYPLKKIMADTFGITLDELEEYKNSALRLVTEESNGYQKDISNFRLILQRFGTEGMKPQFGDGVWSNLLLSKILDNSDEQIILVPDFRFNIESEIIKSSNYRVLTLKIRNDDKVNSDTHPSERELDDYDFDCVIDNTGYSKFLEQKLQEFVKEYDF